MNEHEHEPVPGLPEELPADERLLWQGAPSWRTLAFSRFHVRTVAVYFLAALVWQLYDRYQSGGTGFDMTKAAMWILAPGVLGIGLLMGLAWLTARTSLYTITTRRVVMRVGIALPMTINIPFRTVHNASFRQHQQGDGDLLLGLRSGERCSYLVAWPHVRSGLLSGSQPMLLAIPKVKEVAQVLGTALKQTVEVESTTMVPEITPIRITDAAPASMQTRVRAIA